MDTDRIILAPPSIQEALRDPALAGSAREVYLLCVHHLDVARHRPLKAEGVAVALGLRKATVLRALERLTTLSYLERGPRDGNVWCYRIVWSRPSDGRITPAA